MKIINVVFFSLMMAFSVMSFAMTGLRWPDPLILPMHGKNHVLKPNPKNYIDPRSWNDTKDGGLLIRGVTHGQRSPAVLYYDKDGNLDTNRGDRGIVRD